MYSRLDGWIWDSLFLSFLLFSGVNTARAQVGQDDGPVVAEVQEGKRSGSINYVIGNKLYIKESIYNENLLAHCIHKRRGCRARATLCKDTLEVKSSSKHSCDTDAIHIAKAQLENKMKKMAEETSLSLRQIFDDISQENPVAAAKISWTTIESAMTKRRQRNTLVLWST